jgi:NAD(P)-dependent dehydrogenase (short-subunit alcohol dehydrogenase family)
MLAGKLAIVTGANTGVGKQTALRLMKQGAHVILACRSESRAQAAIEDLRREVAHSGGSVEFGHLDLASLASVRRFAAEVRTKHHCLDILVNNGGLNTMDGSGHERTEDGFEKCFGINYLGHFLLTTALLPQLKHSKDGRIVNVSSVMHRSGTADWRALARADSPSSYASSKLAMVLMARALQRRLDAEGCGNVRAAAVNPGAVNSDIWRTLGEGVLRALLRPLFWAVFLSPERGAESTVHAATAETVRGGDYVVPYFVPFGSSSSALALPFEYLGPFAGCRAVASSRLSYDEQAGEELWSFSESLVAGWR